MNRTWQSIFSQHRRAFAEERSGHLDAAISQFGSALTSFAALLTDGDWQAELRRRAEIIVGTDEAATLVGDFLKLWPRWLLDVHFQRALRALRSGDLTLAQAHWQVLVGATNLAARLEEDTITLYRDRLARECGLESGQNLEDETDERRLDLLGMAQRLLAIDPRIERARLFAMRVCVMQIRLLLQQKRDDAKARHGREARLVRSMAKTRKRTRIQIGRLVRLLTRHLRVMAREPRSDPIELVNGYKVLAAYLSLSDPYRALQVLRRARRITADDPEIRDMIRTLRPIGGH